MKIFLTGVLCLLCAAAIHGQVNEPGANPWLFMPEVTFGPSAIDNNGIYYAGMQGTGSYRLNKYIMAGAGAGVLVEVYELYRSFFAPVFADVRFSLPTGTNTTVFVASSAGYDLGFDNPGGTMLNPYLGVMYQTSPRMGWILGVGYRSRSSSLDGEKFDFYHLRIGVAL